MITPRLKDLLLKPLDGLMLSLHTAEPTLTAASELAGGSYNRQVLELARAEDGTHVNRERLTFLNLPGAAVAAVALWSSDELIFSAPLAPMVQLAPGDGLDLPPGALRFDLTQLPA